MRPALLLLACAALLNAGVAIEWRGGTPQGEVRATGGARVSVKITRGKGAVTAPAGFAASGDGPFRIEAEISGAPEAALVSVATAAHPFTFFLRDVSRLNPILLPRHGVVVTEAGDERGYTGIEHAVRSRGLATELQAIEQDPEESFENAARNMRPLQCQTWLGLSRDIRIFTINERMEAIQTKLHGKETGRFAFLMGRGWGPDDRISRRLEEGTLPILNGRLADGGVTYVLTAFVGLEKRPLGASAVRGTHFLVADGHGGGHMFTREQQAQYDALLPTELNQSEETVLFLRMEAVNTAQTPRYAFFKAPLAVGGEYRAGLGLDKAGQAFAAATLNAKPLVSDEVSILLAPGASARLEVFLPHRAIPAERARSLAGANFDQHRAACRAYWQAKLTSAARIRVPEQRIDEMIRAGLLHLDLITYGMEPEATLTSTIGVYSAIGSESSPIIQFLDSMGWTQVARRSLTYFLDKQHEDGFIQNFGGYMLETGAALWSMGEHYRYTRDDAWVRSIAPKLIKSSAYLSNWRKRNLREDLRGRGYGMLEGKTADPEDPFRSFMLNGYAYIGLSRVAEMLRNTNPEAARRWDEEAKTLRQDIRTALEQNMARSPVIPLADGTWCPTAGPWAEYPGPLSLHGDGGRWFTHGAMVSRDSLLGPLYLVYQEVLDPAEPAAEDLLRFHADLMTRHNVAFSQPYYSRHAPVHLERGEVKPFLKTFYNTMAALADRDTYTFWEHYFGASPHKTHEEGWFLMDARRMLYRERGETLDLLGGVPRAWLEDGKRIEVERVASYFGPLTVRVESQLHAGRILAKVECNSARRPRAISVRVPHPLGQKAAWVKGGVYDAASERVRVEPFDGTAEITIGF